MTKYELMVCFDVNDMEDWQLGNDIAHEFAKSNKYELVGAGTGFGQRDMQFHGTNELKVKQLSSLKAKLKKKKLTGVVVELEQFNESDQDE